MKDFHSTKIYVRSKRLRNTKNVDMKLNEEKYQ